MRESLDGPCALQQKKRKLISASAPYELHLPHGYGGLVTGVGLGEGPGEGLGESPGCTFCGSPGRALVRALDKALAIYLAKTLASDMPGGGLRESPCGSPGGGTVLVMKVLVKSLAEP